MTHWWSPLLNSKLNLTSVPFLLSCDSFNCHERLTWEHSCWFYPIYVCFFFLPLLLIPFNHTRKIIFFWTNGMHRDITNALNFKWCKCVSNYIWCESCQLDSFLKTDLRYSKLIRSTRNIKVHKRRHTIPFVRFSLLAPIQYKNMSFFVGIFFLFIM